MRWQALAVIVDALGAFSPFAISAAYHRGHWITIKAVTWWSKADHASIAVLIGVTYTTVPVVFVAVDGIN